MRSRHNRNAENATPRSGVPVFCSTNCGPRPRSGNFLQQLWRRQPNEDSRRRSNSPQFKARYPCFFQTRDVVLAPKNCSDHFIHVWRMAKTKNVLGVLVASEFAEKCGDLGTGQQQIRLAYLLFRIFQGGGKEMRGLHRAHVRRTDQQIRLLRKRSHATRNLTRFLDSFFRQISFRFGRTLWIFAINGDSVAHHEKPHEFSGSRWRYNNYSHAPVARKCKRTWNSCSKSSALRFASRMSSAASPRAEIWRPTAPRWNLAWIEFTRWRCE